MGLLRFLLAASVVISHNGLEQLGIPGLGAVYIFFIISGFVICLVLNEKYQSNLTGFYIARYLRLWPSYCVVMLLTIVFIAPLDFSGVPIYATVYAYFVTATMFLYQTLGWFGFSPQNPDFGFLENIRGSRSLLRGTHMDHMWSIGVEIVFYMFAPLIARKPVRLIVFLVAAYLVHCWIVMNLAPHHPLRRYSALNVSWLFVLGMCAYWIWRNSRDFLDRFTIPAPIASLAGSLFAAWGITMFQLTVNSYPLLADGVFAILALSFVPLFHYTRHAKLDRWIGELSYPIYLAHYPLVAFAVTNHRGDWMWTFGMIAVTAAFAILLTYAVDRPVERLRRRLVKPAPQSRP